MDDPFRRPTVVPALFYGDPWAALDWLEKAFGFQRSMVITDKEGKLAHSEMQVGDGLIYVGSEWADYTVSPTSISGRNTQTVHIHVKDGLDAHCAIIVRELEDQFYGDRTYSAMDPQGHVWTFGQTVRRVTREDAETASGLEILTHGCETARFAAEPSLGAWRLSAWKQARIDMKREPPCNEAILQWFLQNTFRIQLLRWHPNADRLSSSRTSADFASGIKPVVTICDSRDKSTLHAAPPGRYLCLQVRNSISTLPSSSRRSALSRPFRHSNHGGSF